MALTAGEEAAAAGPGLVLLRYYQTLHSASAQTHKTSHWQSDFMKKCEYFQIEIEECFKKSKMKYTQITQVKLIKQQL